MTKTFIPNAYLLKGNICKNRYSTQWNLTTNNEYLACLSIILYAQTETPLSLEYWRNTWAEVDFLNINLFNDLDLHSPIIQIDLWNSNLQGIRNCHRVNRSPQSKFEAYKIDFHCNFICLFMNYFIQGGLRKVLTRMTQLINGPLNKSKTFWYIRELV